MINPPSKSRTPSALKIVTHRASLKWHPYTSDRGSSWNKLSSGIHSFNSLLPNGASSSFSSNPSQRALPRGRGKGRGRHKKSIQGISSPNPSTSPVHFPVNDCKETPSPRPQTLSDPASDDDNSQQEYIPRAKLTLACANEPYAKDLVAQCVAMIQEIYLLPPDPPLPPGVYLPGHTPPLSPIHPQPQQHPLAAQPHGQALVNQLLTPPVGSISGSPTDSSEEDDSGEDDSEENDSNSTPPHPYPGTLQQPVHPHPPITLTPAQQAATFAQNLLYFVHEVLRRSRTPCTTLEVAMCYIGAVRLAVRTLLAEREELQRHLRLNNQPFQPEMRRIIFSPLHDARRTFLASLVLASKFQQDRAYSNKAWAKLSGLPAQEVTRCENALGNALQWRLWVGRDIRVAATDLHPIPTLPLNLGPVLGVPGIVSSGRCLSPPTCNISADMLEMELFQEELLAGGVHSAHGPNGIPGETDVIAARFIAVAQAEETSLRLGKVGHFMRRHATEPGPEVFAGRIAKSLSVGDLGRYAVGDCTWHLGGECGAGALEFESFSPDPSFNEWLVDDLYGSSPPAMTAAELRGNVLLYETESEFGMSDGRSSSCTSSQGDSIFSDGTAASTPASTPTQSICDPTCLSKDYIPSPAAPRLLEPVLPTSSVVGAFRVPRTPLPRMVIPASADAVGWFPPPHLVHKMSVYTPPTEYRLLPQVTPPVTLAKPVQSFAGSSLSSSISSHSAHVNTPGDSSESQLTPGPALHDFPSSTGYAVMVG